MSTAIARVGAVVVAYQPDVGVLHRLLAALATQVEAVVVVDNGSAGDRSVPMAMHGIAHPGLMHCAFGENRGIAAALNAGAEQLISLGMTHLLLSDQDSLPEQGMVAGLLDVAQRLEAEGTRVGAVAPAFVDRNTGIAFPLQVAIPGKFFYGHRRPTPPDEVLEALTLITSGMLIPVQALRDVGGMREDFFIDHVDIEWCHRARARGWKLFGTSRARMLHSMGGDEPLRVWYFGWRLESAYGPVRMYYRVRNFVALCRLDYVPGRWKLRNAWYWLGFIYSHVVFGRERWGSLLMALRGLFDGARGVSGAYRAR